MTDNKEFKILQLDNGIRCINRRTDSPVAYISLTIGAGTRDESEVQHGVAHLVEHMLFKGTTSHKSHYINSVLDSVGGELNAFTAKEETVLHATCAVQYAKKGAKLLCDMVMNSVFDSREIEKEKEVIADEINSYKDSPAELIFDEFEELLFEGSALGRNILGNKRTLKRVSREDLVAFCRDNYTPDRIVFAMSSSLSDKEFERLCKAVFEDIPTNKTEEATREKVQKVPLFDVVRKKRVAQAHVVIGGYAPAVFDRKRLAAALLINIIGGPSALSRMNMILREKHALTYNTEAAYCPFSDMGLFTLYFSCEASKLARAEELLTSELRLFADEEVSKIRLARFKKQFIGQLLIANQNAEGSMLSAAKSMLVFSNMESTEAVVDRIKTITAAELQEVAREMFHPGNLYKLSYQ